MFRKGSGAQRSRALGDASVAIIGNDNPEVLNPPSTPRRNPSSVPHATFVQPSTPFALACVGAVRDLEWAG
jgi:hypothetical protein